MRIVLAAVAVIASLAPAQARVSTKCLPAQLKSALAHVAKHHGQVRVVSAYRRGARIAGTRKRSKHASCRAVDFHIRGNRKAALAWLRKQPLEIITYSGAMHHIHIAIGSYRGHHVVDRRGVRQWSGKRQSSRRATATPARKSSWLPLSLVPAWGRL